MKLRLDHLFITPGTPGITRFKRKMVPVYNGKVVGKTWARDSSGQLSFSAYMGRSKEINEDLYPLHLSSLNRERIENGK